VIIIAHRLSTVVGAHHIVVLGSGQIIEQGTHQELYATHGNYYQMWQKQLPVGIDPQGLKNLEGLSKIDDNKMIRQ
jgi:ATP-binding cassette subfamily B protein